MGQELKYLSDHQKQILDRLFQEKFIQNNFYFTGGTALSSLYLHHRYSDDLDIFSPQKFEDRQILELMNRIATEFEAKSVYEKIFDRLTFDLTFENQSKIKIDFVDYPYLQLDEKVHVDNITVDSLLDIGVNKLLMITQRTNPKDFVDLYFIFQKHTIWDLRHGVERKFKMELEPLFLGALFLQVEDFDVLPRMIKELSLDELKRFFREKAEKLGDELVED